MRRPAIIALGIALVAAGAAQASDPQKRLNPTDQARARAMLLRQSDVGLGFRPVRRPSTPNDVDLNCDALDEGDLTVTGQAQSPTFTSGLQTISSASGLYESVGDANASWRRGTSRTGFACLKNVFRQLARTSGVRFVSFLQVPFPAVAPRTAAYRWQSLVAGVRVYADVVFLMRSRAQAAAFFISGVDPLERSEQLRLTRAIAKRMAKALRSP
jgi:hypothetical protein